MSGGPHQPPPAGPGPYDAVVLAGGAARRLGGRDKPGLRVGGRRLLDRVLDAVDDAARVVVVGPPRPGLPPHAVTVREQPPGGGPVAALAAGLAAVRSPAVALLAADLPFVTPGVVRALRAALEAGGPDLAGALLVDDGGVDQVLVGVWRTAALRTACGALPDPAGASVRRLLAPLPATRVTAPPGAGPPPWWDCDTDDDLRRAEERA